MPIVYVAASKSLQAWGKSVGVTKHLFKAGVAQDKLKEFVLIMNSKNYAGRNDWKIVDQQEIEGVDESSIINRLREEVEMLESNYYPQIRDAVGIFKIKPEKVENSLIIQFALENKDKPVGPIKIRAKEMARYLLDKVTALKS